MELMNVVTATVPPKLTTEAATKFVPLTVSVKAVPPAVTVFGDTEVTAGMGLGWLITLEPMPPPHPTRHKIAATPSIAGRFISFLRSAFSFLMPLKSSRISYGVARLRCAQFCRFAQVAMDGG